MYILIIKDLLTLKHVFIRVFMITVYKLCVKFIRGFVKRFIA
jgi:hypothetical protein